MTRVEMVFRGKTTRSKIEAKQLGGNDKRQNVLGAKCLVTNKLS